jgi:hypothetical protein
MAYGTPTATTRRTRAAADVKPASIAMAEREALSLREARRRWAELLRRIL